jgi:hypothetical protein
MKHALKYSKQIMHPEGKFVATITTTGFCAHNKADIEALVHKQFSKMNDYPEGDKQRSYWTWGFYKMNPKVENLRDAECMQHHNHYVCMRDFGVSGSKFFEGALKEANATLGIFHNNYDVMCFIKFETIEETLL